MKGIFRSRRGMWAVLGAVQLGIVLVAAMSLRTHGAAFGLTALVMACSLGLLNFGLLWGYRRSNDLQKSLRRLSLLAEMNVQVNREVLLNGDIDLIYRTILNYLFKIFEDASTGSVLILGDDGHFTFAASRGFSQAFVQDFHLKLEDCFLHQVTHGNIREARLITAEDFRHLETVFKPGWEYKSVISAPIFVGDRLFGLLNLDSTVSSTYDAQDVEIVERFRTQIEVVLLARERYATDIESYHVDSLTGLLSRRYFEDLFHISLERAKRHKETFVLALFDVDGLKHANDTYGHLAGDQLLLAVANVLQGACRNSDMVGRLGGDEFIAVYHQTDAALINKSIGDIRAKFQAQALLFATTEYHPSFSYGLASFPQDGMDQAALIAAADKQLYAMKFAAKQSGRV